MCVSKLQSQIQILVQRWIPVKFHSNHSANFACVRKNIQNIFWEAELTWPLCLCTHVFIYKFVPPLENSHSKDELQSSFKLQIFSRVYRSDHSKDELQSSLQSSFSLVCNRSKSTFMHIIVWYNVIRNHVLYHIVSIQHSHDRFARKRFVRQP